MKKRIVILLLFCLSIYHAKAQYDPMAGHYGLMATEGKIVLPLRYDLITDGKVLLQHKYAVIDPKGNILTPFIYDDIDQYNNKNYSVDKCRLFPVQENGKWGFLDPHSLKPLTSFKYDDYKNYRDGMADVEIGDHWGAINIKGEEVVPCIYDKLDYFSGFLAIAEKDKKKMIINSSGRVLIPLTDEYVDAGMYNSKNALGWIRIGNKEALIDSTGKFIIPFTDQIGGLRANLATVKKGDKYAFIDKNQKYVTPFVYDEANPNKYGGGGVGEKKGIQKNEYEYLDSLGVVKLTSSNLMMNDEDGVRVYPDPDFYDFSGKFIKKWMPSNAHITDSIKTRYRKIEHNLLKYSSVTTLGDLFIVGKNIFFKIKCGLCNASGEEITPCIYDAIYTDIKDGTIEVEKDEKKGLLNVKGELIVPCVYDWVTKVSKYVITRQNRKLGFVTIASKHTTPCIYKDLYTLGDVIVAQSDENGRWGILDETGKVTVPFQYDLIRAYYGNLLIVATDYIHDDVKNN